MFYGWRSPNDGSRMPRFWHIVIRSKDINDGYTDYLVAKTSWVIFIALWTIIFTLVGLFVGFNVKPAFLAVPWFIGAWAPFIGAYSAYQKYWKDYLK